MAGCPERRSASQVGSAGHEAPPRGWRLSPEDRGSAVRRGGADPSAPHCPLPSECHWGIIGARSRSLSAGYCILFRTRAAPAAELGSTDSSIWKRLDERMALELSKIVDQVDGMARELAVRAERQRKALPAARALLHQFAVRRDELRRVAESEAGRRWRCASPGDERLDEGFAAPEMPEHVTLVAADGSQIYPDRHGLAFYYVINVGSIVFRHGSGQAPTVGTSPRLCYLEDQLYPGGNPATGDLVSAERDLAEIRILAELALAEAAAGVPCFGLADGSLLIWLQRAAIP